MVYPSIYMSFIIKLQCFCFNTLFVNSLETLELPVLFYMQDTISSIQQHNIYIYYIILCTSVEPLQVGRVRLFFTF